MMKVRRAQCGFWLLLVGFLFSAGPIQAREPDLEPVGRYGSIDWVGRKIRAAGIGAPSAGVNPAQARMLARRAAEVVARRNLLEVVKGVRIDSRTTVVDYAVRDDTIVSKVEGVLEGSRVEQYRDLADGAVEASVVMPLGGSLEEMLLQAASRPGADPSASADMQQRMHLLEERVRLLEERAGMFKRLYFEQNRALRFLGELLAASQDRAAAPFLARAAASDADRELKSLRGEISRQRESIAELFARLQEIADRIEALEAFGTQPDTVPREAEAAGDLPPYTGLVIDARRSDFKPCLKPEIYWQGQLVYPGEYINPANAIRSGYVRYYREIEAAQQSSRAGRLPLTVTARPGEHGRGSLAIDAEAHRTLRKLIQTVDNFMANCSVVIVF